MSERRYVLPNGTTLIHDIQMQIVRVQFPGGKPMLLANGTADTLDLAAVVARIAEVAAEQKRAAEEEGRSRSRWSLTEALRDLNKLLTEDKS